MIDHAMLDIGMVLVGTLASAFCIVKGIMTGFSRHGGWNKSRASLSFGVGCSLLAVTGLRKTDPWVAFLAAGFMLIGAVLMQRERESRVS